MDLLGVNSTEESEFRDDKKFIHIRQLNVLMINYNV